MNSRYPTQKPSGHDHWAFEFKRLRSDLNRRNDGFAIHCLKPLGDGALKSPSELGAPLNRPRTGPSLTEKPVFRESEAVSTESTRPAETVTTGRENSTNWTPPRSSGRRLTCPKWVRIRKIGENTTPRDSTVHVSHAKARRGRDEIRTSSSLLPSSSRLRAFA